MQVGMAAGNGTLPGGQGRRSGRRSKRLNWNYAQVLQQTGLTDDAVRVLREAAAGDAPQDFKAAVTQTIEAWTQELTGCGVPLGAKSPNQPE